LIIGTNMQGHMHKTWSSKCTKLYALHVWTEKMYNVWLFFYYKRYTLYLL